MAGHIMKTCEFLTHQRQSMSAKDIMDALQNACLLDHVITTNYLGRSDLLVLWGAGSQASANAIHRHLDKGRRVLCWDYGYFNRAKRGGHLRVSIDYWHPQHWLDKTEPDPERWDLLGIPLRNDYDPQGHIVLVGMGPKSHSFLGTSGWERNMLIQLRQRFPGREVVFRPKPFRDFAPMPCKTVTEGDISELLKGASLVVCRHSNVAVDAVVAGVPFECEDGAASWLAQKDYSVENRLDFLRRLAWWQWHPTEAGQAWKFLLGKL